MTHAEAKRLIVANGYEVLSELPGRITVIERRYRGRVDQRWTGVSWRDLAVSFRLHEREARK